MSTRNEKKANGPLGWTPPDFKDGVTVVAGASRGAGRGMAVALAETGATIYVSGRTTRDGPKPFDGAPGTIEDTAEEVTRRGGVGIPVRCDHAVESEVAALFERVRGEQGRLDILANGVWGSSEESLRIWKGKSAPFWELESNNWKEAMLVGAHAAFLASMHAARLMAPRQRGLIVHVTELAADPGEGAFGMFQLFHTLGHLSINRMAEAMSRDLVKRKIAIVPLAPGFMRTERVLINMQTMTEKQKQAYRFDLSETTEYVGRAVASLAADAKLLQRSGKLLYVGDLAKEYGFKDADGKFVANLYRELKMI